MCDVVKIKSPVIVYGLAAFIGPWCSPRYTTWFWTKFSCCGNLYLISQFAAIYFFEQWLSKMLPLQLYIKDVVEYKLTQIPSEYIMSHPCTTVSYSYHWYVEFNIMAM